MELLGKAILLYFDHGGDKPLIAVIEDTRTFETGVCLGLTFAPQQLYLFDAEGKRLRVDLTFSPRDDG